MSTTRTTAIGVLLAVCLCAGCTSESHDDLGLPVAEVVADVDLDGRDEPGPVDGVAGVAPTEVTSTVAALVTAANRGDRDEVATVADPHLVDGILLLPTGAGELSGDDLVATPGPSPESWQVLFGSELGWGWFAEVQRRSDGSWGVVGIHGVGGGR